MRKVLLNILILAVAIGSFLSPISAAAQTSNFGGGPGWYFIGQTKTSIGQIFYTVSNPYPDEATCKTNEAIVPVNPPPGSLYTIYKSCAQSNSMPSTPDSTGGSITETTEGYGIAGSSAVAGGGVGSGFSGDNLPACGLNITGDGSSMYGCIVQIFYYVFWMPTNFLAYYAGKLLDFFVFYSIDSNSYDQSGFINEGWKVVRDIANISFIFVLLYVALRTILNLGGSQSKKMITWVVVIALLINFSLFFTKVIVDAGNILAGVLYGQISSEVHTSSISAEGSSFTVSESTSGEKEISAGLVNQFDPQKIMNDAGIRNQTEANAVKTPYLIIIIMATIVNVFMITTFVSIALMFVGRVVGIMFAMIFSPFAFMSLTIPGSGSFLKQWSWDKWLSELLNVTFMAPIFIFFLWLIISFQKVGWLDSVSKIEANGVTLSNVISVILPFVLILALLYKAKEITKSMAGEVATKLSGLAEKGVGFLGGAALGGAALLGRATVGRFAAGQLEGAGGKALRDRAARGDAFARAQLQAFEGVSRSSLDLRKTKVAEKFQKETGLDLQTTGVRIPLTNIDLKTEGGYRGATDREKKRQEGISNLFKETGKDADTLDKRSKEWQKQYDKEEGKAELAAFNAQVSFNKADFRKMYEGGNVSIKDKAGVEVYGTKTGAPKGAPKELSASETNAKRMRDQADSVEYGTNYVTYRDAQIKSIQERSAQKLATGQTLGDDDKYDENQVKNAFLAQNEDYVKNRDDARVKMGASFDENVWREEEYLNKKIGRTDQEIVADLRKKAGEEIKKDKSASAKDKILAEKTLQRTTNKLNDISQHLKDIADEYNRKNPGSNKTPDQVDQNDLKSALGAKITTLDTAEIELEKAKKDFLAGAITSAVYGAKKEAWRCADSQVSAYKTLFADKEKTEKDMAEAEKIKNS